MKTEGFGFQVLVCLALVFHGGSAAGAEQRDGKATVYSNSFSGRKTATGETFKQDAMTAASPSLPLGSKVLVKNKATGKSAVVKVNDRQPKGGGKVVDLSKAAANKLGVKGTAPVKAKVLSEKH